MLNMIAQSLFDFFYIFFLLLLSPYLLYHMFSSKKYPVGILQKLGKIPKRSNEKPCLWFHGVSAGELLLIEGLVKTIENSLPDIELVFSTSTATGYDIALKRYGDKLIFFFPFDFSWITKRVLNRIRPCCIVLVEFQIWPNFVLSATNKNIPIIVVDGRISERSTRRFNWIKSFSRNILNRITLFSMQTDSFAERLEKLGVERDRVFVTSSMKFDAIPVVNSPQEKAKVRKKLGIEDDALVIIGGSTHRGEELFLLNAYKEVRKKLENMRLIIAPRYPNRAKEIGEMVQSQGLSFCLRSQLHQDKGVRAQHAAPLQVIILDTMGELSKIYNAADIAFVGGSLVPRGGQNVMEPAGLGKAVLFGPLATNFKDYTDLLLGNHAAMEVKDPEKLIDAIKKLIDDPSLRMQMGIRAQKLIKEKKGATEKNLYLIKSVVESILPPPS